MSNYVRNVVRPDSTRLRARASQPAMPSSYRPACTPVPCQASYGAQLQNHHALSPVILRPTRKALYLDSTTGHGRSISHRFPWQASTPFPFIAPLFLAEPFSIFLVILPPDSDIASHHQLMYFPYISMYVRYLVLQSDNRFGSALPLAEPLDPHPRPRPHPRSLVPQTPRPVVILPGNLRKPPASVLARHRSLQITKE
jgi:hypothetical protein